MNKPPPRGIFKMIWTNFVNSLRPRQIRGTLMGSDHFGNKYFEIPANPQLGKRRPARWFEPIGKDDNFEQEVPAEWEAWLRGRRSQPPAEEEIRRSYELMQTKKANAKLLEAQYSKGKDVAELVKEERGAQSFPRYTEYEIMPGKPQNKS